MRIILLLMLLLSGCGRSAGFSPTKFVTSHDANAYFVRQTDEKAHQVGARSQSHALESTRACRDFQIVVRGDQILRGEIMEEYSSYVENELKTCGLAVDGRSTERESGGLNAFELGYTGANCVGFVRARSVMGENSRIHIDVLIYEHP